MDRQENHEIREIPERFRLQDLDQWLQLNGLRSVDDQEDNTTLDRLDDIRRVDEGISYQKSIHERFFQGSEQAEQKNQTEKIKLLDSIKHIKLEIIATDGKITNLPLAQLARSCDTILAFASSREHWFTPDPNTLQFSLDFPRQSVLEFLRIVLEEQPIHDIKDSCLVDCCRISHFLQNSTVLEQSVDLLIDSIDTENCLALCELADQLGLVRLWEASLFHLLDKLGQLQDDESWSHLTPELQDRICNMQKAVHSSIHSQSHLYFSSLDEYLAMFAERVEYYQERLIQAKDQQREIELSSRGWKDAQEKIERQEVRVRTLRLALEEQKKLFAVKDQ